VCVVCVCVCMLCVCVCVCVNDINICMVLYSTPVDAKYFKAKDIEYANVVTRLAS